MTNKPNIIKADKSLQQKVGTGSLNTDDVKNMQSAIDNNDFDFAPIGLKFLDQLLDVIQKTKTSKDTDLNEFKDGLIGPVMQLKANAAIFKFSLIGDLANIMLSFLETINQLDKDAVAIVEAHHSTLNAIITKNIRGDGGQVGRMMVKELKEACTRYYAKRKGA